MSKLLPFSLPASPSLVVLAGLPFSGKTTWANKHFPAELIFCDRFASQTLTGQPNPRGMRRPIEAWLAHLATQRITNGQSVVLDSTHVTPQSRQELCKRAKALNVPCTLVWFDLSLEQCNERLGESWTPGLGERVASYAKSYASIAQDLTREPWDHVVRVGPQGQMEHQVVKPTAMRRFAGQGGVRLEHDAFDVIGDVHGCFDALVELMEELGWTHTAQGWTHPEGRHLVFVGDLVDRGPKSVEVVQLVYDLVQREVATLVLGNHDDKLMRHFKGSAPKLSYSVQVTVSQIEALGEEAKERFVQQLLSLFGKAPYWALLGHVDESEAMREPDAAVVVAHAAWKPSMRWLPKLADVRRYCVYGPSTGRNGLDGYPERLDWTRDYPSDAPLCVVGHVPYLGEVRQENNTLSLDTAAVFGGVLSAFCWPSGQVVQVKPKRLHWEHEALGDRPGRIPFES